jgi:hypothetical protein
MVAAGAASLGVHGLVLLMTLVERKAVWLNATLAWLWLAPAFIPWFAVRARILATPILLRVVVALSWHKPEGIGVWGLEAPVGSRG